MKPTFKAPQSKLLKLECDEPLSNFAFKFKLRRYIWDRSGPKGYDRNYRIMDAYKVGWGTG